MNKFTAEKADETVRLLGLSIQLRILFAGYNTATARLNQF